MQKSRRPLLAPQLLIAEVADALRKHVRVGDITIGQATDALQALPGCFSEIVAMQLLAAPALEIAQRLEHSAYDCFYVALAEDRAVKLVTADMRLLNRVARTKYKSFVLALSDWT